MHSLDTVRSRLAKMTERILFRLADRAGFPLNPAVYEPGAIPIAGREGISFLEFAVEGLEAYHASLGRYEYPDQHSLTRAALPGSPARREVGVPALPHVDIDLKDRLFRFHRDEVLPRLCEPGSDPNTYGETAYLDADLLELIHERVNVGRYVARAKAETTPGVRDPGIGAEELIGMLRDPAQEERILDGVRVGARSYGVDVDIAAMVFRWVIEETIRVEVAYLHGLPAISS